MSVVRIAEKAGVSIATVSRVLNNSRRVNPKLAEQVHRAVIDLNVDPDKIRRNSARRDAAMQTGGDFKLSSIAIISLGHQYRAWFELPIMAAVVAEIMRAAEERRLATVVTEMPDPREVSVALKRQPVDGALVFVGSGVADLSAPNELAERMPVVRVMGGPIARLMFDHVGPDNCAVGNLACDHLLKRGCGRVAYLTTRPSWDMSKLRAQGFAAAALAAGRRPHVYLEGDAADLDCVYGAELTSGPSIEVLVQKLAASLRDTAAATAGPLGLFVSRDEETVEVYRALATHGLQPGRDLVVVSCDNESIRLSALDPRPVSIDLNPRDIARHAVQRLVERIRHPQDPPVRLLVTPTLGV